jgi:hypothetical protein
MAIPRVDDESETSRGGATSVLSGQVAVFDEDTVRDPSELTVRRT